MTSNLQPGDMCVVKSDGSVVCFCKLLRKTTSINQHIIWYYNVVYTFDLSFKEDSERSAYDTSLEKYDVVKLSQLRMCIDNMIRNIIKTQTT
jgi:hypothetical protein